jgi:hypothetical protein
MTNSKNEMPSDRVPNGEHAPEVTPEHVGDWSGGEVNQGKRVPPTGGRDPSK